MALKGVNDEEAFQLVEWAHGRGAEITFIEVMPLGEVDAGRIDQYLPLTQLRATLSSHLTLTPSAYRAEARRATTMLRKRRGE